MLGPPSRRRASTRSCSPEWRRSRVGATRRTAKNAFALASSSSPHKGCHGWRGGLDIKRLAGSDVKPDHRHVLLLGPGELGARTGGQSTSACLGLQLVQLYVFKICDKLEGLHLGENRRVTDQPCGQYSMGWVLHLEATLAAPPELTAERTDQACPVGVRLLLLDHVLGNPRCP